MAQFDQVLAELQAKLHALNTILAQHPEVAAKVAAAVDGATPDPVVVEEKAQDDARANALNRVIDAARDHLESVKPPTPAAAGPVDPTGYPMGTAGS
jgi:hypothetical protein